MKKFNIYLAILILCLGSICSMRAADYPPFELEELSFSEQEEAPSLEENMAILNSLEVDPSPIFEASVQDLRAYLTMITRIKAEKSNPELYDGLADLILSAIEGKTTPQDFPIPAAIEQEPSLDVDIAKMLLDGLKQNPSTISNPATDDQELDGYLVMIESIRKSEGDQSAYEVLKNLIQREKKTRSKQRAPKEKSAEEIRKEKATNTILLFLNKNLRMIGSYPLKDKKNLLNYMWQKGLANDPPFRRTYQLMLNSVLQFSHEQAKTNNLKAFDQDAQFIPLPINENPGFGFYIVDMNKIKIDGRSIIQRQRDKDCGFHAAFNGLELYRFAQGLIDKQELEELLPNFDVNEWKNDPRYSCSGVSYIDSGAIDNILKSHGLTEKDYSIIESIERYEVSMDIVQKLALALFDPAATQFSHVIIIQSETRDHWTVAVINKTDDQIRVYTADSLFGDVEAQHIKKIMQLVSQVNVKEKEFEALMNINRTLSSIADVHSNQERTVASKNESIIINLLSILPVLYKENVTATPYFLKNFSQQILEYINELLTDQSSPATGIAKRMLEQLKTTVETTDLPNIPPLLLDQAYDTLLDKYALVTLLELHRTQDKLNEEPADVSPQNISKIYDAIETVRIYKTDNKVLKDLQSTIPIHELPNIDLNKEYQTIDEMIYLLSQLEMYRSRKELEQLLAQSNKEQIDNILNAIQTIRITYTFEKAFEDLESAINAATQKEEE